MKNFAIYLAAGASTLLMTALPLHHFPRMHQSYRTATFKTSAWFATRTAAAGANVVNAASLSVSPVIHTDMPPRERYIERRGYEERGGGIGIRAPGVSVGIGTLLRKPAKA